MDEKQRISDNIVSILESVLTVHNSFEDQLPTIKRMYGEKMFRESCQTITLSLPRRSGHTTAAIEILHRYPHALLISTGSIVAAIKRQNSSAASNMLTLNEALAPQAGHALRIIGALSNIDFILLDTVKVTQGELDTLFELYSPRLIVLLGGSKIVSE